MSVCIFGRGMNTEWYLLACLYDTGTHRCRLIGKSMYSAGVCAKSIFNKLLRGVRSSRVLNIDSHTHYIHVCNVIQEYENM